MNLEGNGTAVQHHVNLSWIAPADSPVPITGYNIYRTTGSSSFQILGSSTATEYIDLMASPSTTYSYYVTSTNRAGEESVPSAVVTVTIP